MMGRKFVTSAVGVGLLASAMPAGAADSPCTSGADKIPHAEDVVFRNLDRDDQGYDVLRLEASDGAHMLIYFDEASEEIARNRAACLGSQMNVLRAELEDTRVSPEWDSVVFTSDENYTPPRGGGVTTRWVIGPHATGRIDDGQVLTLIPHEQVHSFQRRNSAFLPRWISEGHASWTEQRILKQLDETVARQEAARSQKHLRESTAPLDLAAWSSVRPKREAIRRQVSKADQKRMDEDPSFSPEGTFTFTTDDLEGDESNMTARYAGALLVFQGLEQRHGAEAVHAWLRDLTEDAGTRSPEEVADSIQKHFGEDVAVLLDNRQFPSAQ